METLWNEALLHIVTAKLTTELCFTCQQNSRLLKSVNLLDSIKSKRVQKAQKHLDQAHSERAFYNAQCKI